MGLVKGKKLHDKRETMKKRDTDRGLAAGHATTIRDRSDAKLLTTETFRPEQTQRWRNQQPTLQITDVDQDLQPTRRRHADGVGHSGVLDRLRVSRSH